MGWASHLTYRLMTMMRGGLVTLIYSKMTELQLVNVSESAAMTLMGTDVQRIAETFHYVIADAVPAVIQLGIAAYLLYVQLGVAFIAPIIITISKACSCNISSTILMLTCHLVATALSVLLADQVAKRQKAWLESTQRRINFTSEILGSMKNVKMLGLTSQMSHNIQQLREDEIAVSKRYRRVQACNVALGQALSHTRLIVC